MDTAANGQLALARLQERAYDVILSDLRKCALSDILATSPDNLAKNRVMRAIEYKAFR